MELPVNVKTIIDEMTAGVKINHLREISDKISSKYKMTAAAASLILDDEEAPCLLYCTHARHICSNVFCPRLRIRMHFRCTLLA